MAKVGLVAIVACVVMVLVSAAPLVSGGEHVVLKGAQGPKANTVTWTFVAEDYGQWRAHIVNDGLRWIVLDVYDNATGVPIQISHERINFASSGAYPTGTVDSGVVMVAKGRTYEVVAIPNGPRGSSATVTDFGPWNDPPIASFICTVSGMTLMVDASASYDVEGWIADYLWSWGDGSSGSGVQAVHTYASGGLYTVTLTAVDNVGASTIVSRDVQFFGPPIAVFTTYTQGMTVFVDGSGSYSPSGAIILQWAWNWCDGSTTIGDGPFAQHTYAVEGLYSITLTITDSNGWTCSCSLDIISHNEPPVATFTCTVSGTTITVDASASSDDQGIVDWVWSWGDGTDPSHGVMATHSYSGREGGPPSMPFTILASIYAPNGGVVPSSMVRLENTRTGDFMLVLTGDGMASFDLNRLASSFISGDVINITAWGNGMVGYAEFTANVEVPYLQIDVTLSPDYIVPSLETTVTLSAIDAQGLTTQISNVIVFPVP